ncbi:MAG: flagellar motor stator protein MotA [Rickettsiales bacterium]|nr:flagellar motor stator protein MotA [Pseudomonadota bacterium]MDA0967454.1 flagellar motor stator protein MotA [Pseudomonadota bacterium]MDG4544178.1 flagellar motor stator protein MotA [Rickettsiales bacterium]MDG4546359.1 flagellar motor stator protein MotA [Rickettsiales bacterium]MDG4548502.1 flagellar motor stator protein MotA [Rickettsiales bacterium]
MLFIIGTIVVFGAVATGYAMHHGNFAVLWQPNEFVIILGAAIGSFLLGNPGFIIKKTLKTLKNLFKGTPYKKDDYIQLLMFLFNICKLMKTKGMLAVEEALDNPESSELFTAYPKFLKNHHSVDFFCDYMRMVTMGMDNHYQLEDLMDKEIEKHHHETATPSVSLNTMADAMPALGIVAAVLGVIQTMGSITEPPEILGGLIGAALVGTFFGVLVSYGFFAPMAALLSKFADSETEYFEVMKAAMISHVQGNAPVITVEVARKFVPGHLKPSFKEIDALINGSS